MDNNEMVQIQEILSELDPTNNSSTFYKSNASSIKGITLEVSSYHSLIAYCAESYQLLGKSV